MQKEIHILKSEYKKWLDVRPKKLSKVPAELRENIMALVNNGQRAEVCRFLGISSSTVSNWKTLELKDKVLSTVPKTEKKSSSAFSYSRAEIPSSGATHQRGLAELELTLSGQKINLRFHEAGCLERIIKGLLKGAWEL